MKDIAEKLAKVEQQIAEEKGDFLLFALFLTEDSSGYWDLLVSAAWMAENKSEALKYINAKIQKALTPDEIMKLSKIVIIDKDNPELEALQEAFQRSIHIEHGIAEIKNSNFFGLEVRHAFLITSKRDKSSNPQAPAQPSP